MRELFWLSDKQLSALLNALLYPQRSAAAANRCSHDDTSLLDRVAAEVAQLDNRLLPERGATRRRG